jgi:hypothetical protein
MVTMDSALASASMQGPSKGSLKGYEFSSFWEKASALDASQISAISLLGDAIASAQHRNFADSTPDSSNQVWSTKTTSGVP